MPASGQTLTYNKIIHAVQSQVYNAFTNASALREWMCNIATVNPKPDGHFFVAWREGFYASGEYTELKPDEKVAFTWFGKGEPGQTLVSVNLVKHDGGTLITLEHSGVGSSELWSRTIDNFQSGWKDGLDNLASVLETGQDLRFTLRPMLGIGINDFDAEIAMRIGVPVSQGVRIDKLMDGMGAEAAGLHQDDVIINLGGKVIAEISDISSALQSHRAGDEIEVVLYRGNEKKTLPMKLSQRPLPEIPATPQALSERYQERNERAINELMGFIKGVTESEADYKPGNTEWNIKEILAHLIHNERDFQKYVPEIIGGQEPQYDGYVGNLQAHVEATVAAYPTLSDIFGEYKCSLSESEALLARLPVEVTAKKGSYWRLCNNTLENPFHFESHLDQMRAAVQAARGKK